MDLVRARIAKLNKYFHDGAKPARTSTSRLVLGDIDSHGSESYVPAEEEEEEEGEGEEESEDDDDDEEDNDDDDDKHGDIEPG